MLSSASRLCLAGLVLFSCTSVARASETDDFDQDEGADPGDMDMPYAGEDEEGDDGDDGGRGARGGGGTTLGVIALDNYTFDKWVGLPGYKLLIKFDVAYPYHELQDEWVKLAPLAQNVSQFFVADVTVDFEEGFETNSDLAKRYNLHSADDLPAVFLFNGPSQRSRYSGTNDTAHVGRWLRRLGVKFPTIGTLSDLDVEVRKFMRGGHTEAQMKAAHAIVDTQYKDDKRAALYPKIMKKIQEKGSAYVDGEIRRVEKILLGSLAEEKRSELAGKLLILGVFEEANAKDEL